MASLSKARKREWGKSREKPNVVILEKMDLEVPDRVDSNLTVTILSTNNLNRTRFDLQHPEMLTCEQLVDILTKHHVPIPVYSDGSPSRERLLYLFRKHILPRPQRLRRENSRQSGETAHTLSIAMAKCQEMELAGKEDEVTEEWENTTSHLQRKRTSTQSDTDVPPAKKPVTIATTQTPPRKLKRPTVLRSTKMSTKMTKIN